VSEPARDRILLVCTANQCRSPLAEAIARKQAATLPVDFASGGLISGGFPMPPRGVRVARKLGLDLRTHVSRQLDPVELKSFDVILTMTREHARRLVAARPELWPNVFTLKQFSRWLAAHPRPSSAALGTWLAEAARERPRSELIGSNPHDDVVDPIASSSRVWREVATELDHHIRGVLAALYPA
jgi:protein-tyrosine phosphatase